MNTQYIAIHNAIVLYPSKETVHLWLGIVIIPVSDPRRKEGAHGSNQSWEGTESYGECAPQERNARLWQIRGIWVKTHRGWFISHIYLPWYIKLIIYDYSMDYSITIKT